MSWFILAAALGANTVIVFLLFRRLRSDLSRQVTAIRVEIHRDRVIRQLTRPNGIGRVGTEDEAPEAALAVGDGDEPPVFAEQPIRRKKHLAVYRGGALAAAALALIGGVQDTWRTHRNQVVGGLAGITVTATTVTLLTLSPWDSGTNREPPSSAPTAGPTFTPLPPDSPDPQSPGSSAPSANPSHTADSGREIGASSASSEPVPASSPQDIGSLVPIGDEPLTPSATGSPTPGGSEPPPADPEPEDPAPPTTPPPAEPPAEEPENPPASGLCIGLILRPVADIQVCLLQGGADT